MGALLITLSLLTTADTAGDESPSAPAATVPETESPAEPDEPAEPADKPQLVVLELDAIDVDEKQVEIITGRIADVLGRERTFTTLTSTDLRQMMDVAAERQSMGCDTDACIAELAQAYGARYVVYGRVAKVSDLVLMQLSLFDADAAKPISRREIEGATLRDVLDATAGGAKDLVLPLTGRPVAPLEPEGWSPGALFWVGGGLGIAGLAAGAALGAWATNLYFVSQATGGAVPPNDKVRAAQEMPFYGVGSAAGAGVALFGVGLLATDFFIE